MSYPKEVQAIFDLTFKMLSKDEEFDQELLDTLHNLYDKENLDNEDEIGEILDTLIGEKELKDG